MGDGRLEGMQIRLNSLLQCGEHMVGGCIHVSIGGQEFVTTATLTSVLKVYDIQGNKHYVSVPGLEIIPHSFTKLTHI